MPLHADFRRFFRREHGSVTIEAICFLVFLMTVAVSCFALFPIVKNGASGAIDNRTVIRNASLNESCSHTGLFPGQPITVGFREKSQVTIHCNMNINGETAVEDDQRFWTMLQAAGDAKYPNLNRAQEPVMAFSAVQSEQFSTFFGSPTSTSMIWFNNETFAPSNETWLFNVPRWAEGHDKVIWENFTNRQKDLFPRVYPSAKTPSTGTASASNLEELEIDYASAVRPDFNITEELERITAVAATVDTGAVTTATETTVPTQVTASGTGNQPNAPPTSEGGDTGGAPASYATPPLDNLSNYMRETLASRIGTAQGVAEGAIGWVGDMVGGAATAVETVYEAGVVGVEEATGWINDDYAASQQQDLVDRGTGILEAAQELMDDPAAVAEAFAEYYAAQYEHADALEAAYRAGEGDISLYQEAERIRARTTTELGIMGVETAATVVGVGAIAKGLRTARIADKLDGATPLAIALNGVRQTRLATEAVGDLSRQPGRTTPFDMDDVRTRTDELVEARNRDLDEDLAETPSNAPYDARAWRDYYDEFYEGDVTSTTVPPYNAKNVPLAGQRHPNTGVVFDQRGFPVFDDFTVYDTRFTGPEFRNASYQTQMRMGTRDLRTQIENNPQLRSQFNEAQLQAIQSGNAKIPGYTWHHHQDSGRMQLVDEDIHRNTGHIGGEAMSEGQ
ncbi:HNH endonuclease [Loktanella sp. TSTF-M6]|uniref:HNH endonuclease n=1 Tax=Loktanella gaetbuli TaxID=2881335 RepID=A0ABS8BXZ3_9RHOB|nr:HNH endonuclease [Loktanella gaetbuli]MCB5200598.1 HNH endonuclease [Loktanella gaetbuli]